MANDKKQLDLADQLLQKQALLKDREQIRKETIEEILQLEDKIETKLANETRQLEVSVKHRQDSLKEQQTFLGTLNQEIELQALILENNKLSNHLSEEDRIKKEQTLIQLREIYAIQILEVTALKTKVELAAEELEIKKSLVEPTQRVAESFATMVGLSDAWRTGVVMGFKDAAEKGWSFSQALAEQGKAIAAQLSPANLLGNAMTYMAEGTFALFMAQDQAFASLNKATSTMGKYTDITARMRNENVAFGISIEDSAEALMDLDAHMSDFRYLSADVSQRLATTTAYMEKLGVSTKDTAGVLQASTKIFGQTATQAEVTTRQIAGFAVELGISIPKAMEEFGSAAGQLAMHGDRAIEVFKDLQVAAKQTGIAMDRLYGIVEQFQTFEGAAEAAGRLNALLGGDFLDSVTMVHAAFEDPAGALEHLRSGILAAGQSFDDMTPAMRKAVTEAAGLQDVGELAMLMSDNYKDLSGATDAAALSQEELIKRTQANRTIQEEWNSVLQSLAISFVPILKFLNWFIGGVAWLVQGVVTLISGIGNLGDGLQIVLGFVMSLGIAWAIWTFWQWKSAGGTAALALATTELAAAMGVLATAQTASGGTGKVAAGGIASVGAAAAGASYGLGILALVALAIGASFTLIGAGVWLAAKGMAALFGSVKDFGVGNIFKTALGFVAMAGAMQLLAIAIITFAGAALLAPTALLALAGVMAVMEASGFTQLVKSTVELEQIGAELPATKALIESARQYAQVQASFTMDASQDPFAKAAAGGAAAAGGGGGTRVISFPKVVRIDIGGHKLKEYGEKELAKILGMKGAS